MSTCYYCRKKLGINESYYLIRTKETKFRGRNRYQTVAYCCESCEADGKQCEFTTKELRTLLAVGCKI